LFMKQLHRRVHKQKYILKKREYLMSTEETFYVYKVRSYLVFKSGNHR
jgi:hypothetical protein